MKGGDYLDRLAKQQACQLFIEQEIEKGLKEGKSKYSIGKEVAAWIKKFFDADVKPNTITQRAHRIEDKLVTNVTTGETSENDSEKNGNQDDVAWGGEREGAGRLPKLGPPSNGLQFARMAIMDLEQIKPNDLERGEAFNLVSDWILKNK